MSYQVIPIQDDDVIWLPDRKTELEIVLDMDSVRLSTDQLYRAMHLLGRRSSIRSEFDDTLYMIPRGRIALYSF